MAERALEQRVENLERQATAVAQMLPTLATKADLNELRAELKADLKTEWKADIAAAIAPLATKAELQARHADVMRILTRHDRRLTRLEASSASQL